jgi:ubiquinone/menaquinone biosynthesis C-methylase UbiE
MEKKYWEQIAPNYELEIFDVLKNDKSKKIVNSIQSVSGTNKTVIDIGCAIGKWIPVLSPIFKTVHAIDISAKNLSIAKKKYNHIGNLSLERVDMSSKVSKKGKYDVAVCINAILTPNLNKRDLFFKHMTGYIKKGGDLVLVVPSLESKLFSHIVAHKWDIDKIKSEKHTNGKLALKEIRNIKDGVANLDEVPTKHFMKEELELLLKLEGFGIERIEKIAYQWNTEFHKPPTWLKEPLPWDWMVIAKKK